jgi:hypothetical protein
MATMVVQLGLATMPRGMSSRAAALTSGTTRGTSGSIRQPDELSMTIAPAATIFGAYSMEAVLPALSRAMPIPAQSAVAVSSTTTSRPAHSSVVPAERAEAKKRMFPTGKERSWRMALMTPPT